MVDTLAALEEEYEKILAGAQQETLEAMSTWENQSKISVDGKLAIISKDLDSLGIKPTKN